MRPPIHPEPPTWKIVAAFGVIYIVWGSTYLAIRVAVETMPPFLMAGVRYLASGLLMYAWAARGGWPRVTGRQWGNAAVVGLLMMLGGNGLVCWAEQWVASGLAALLVGTIPLWIVVLDWGFFSGTRPRALVLVGLGLGSLGIVELVGPQNLGGERIYLPGAIALLAACASWGFGSLYTRRAELPRPTWVAAAAQMLAGGVALLVVGLLLGEPGRVEWQNVSGRSVLALVYLIGAGSILAMTAYVWLLQVAPPTRVATYAYVNPVIAILLGTLLLDEPLTPRVGISAALIVAAVVLITRSAGAAKRAPLPQPSRPTGPQATMPPLVAGTEKPT